MKHSTNHAAANSAGRHQKADDAGGSYQRILIPALISLQNMAPTSNLLLDLPAAGALRMRNLVHRGTQRPVFKVPSLKLGRVVQCESILEYEATLLMDVSPWVSSFAEQPARIHYELDGEWRAHIPDFAVVAGSRKAMLEIKFEKDVDADVRARTAHLEIALGAVGWGYHLLTEKHLRQGHVVTNALSVLRRARHATCPVATLRTLEDLRQGSLQTLGDARWCAQGSETAMALARLITTGKAGVDLRLLMAENSPVWAADTSTNREGATWLLALSK